jgi:transposase
VLHRPQDSVTSDHCDSLGPIDRTEAAPNRIDHHTSRQIYAAALNAGALPSFAGPAHVVTDITGLTGMRIIRAIVAGNHAPEQLAEFRDRLCHASEGTIREALIGNYRPEHVFALRQALELYDFHQAKVAECDVEIEAVLCGLNAQRVTPEAPLPAVRHAKGRNEPAFDVRPALYTLLGADLSQIHGFGPYTVLRLVAECGDDMTKWPTSKHFTSWLSLAPAMRSPAAASSAPRPAGRRIARPPC